VVVIPAEGGVAVEALAAGAVADKEAARAVEVVEVPVVAADKVAVRAVNRVEAEAAIGSSGWQAGAIGARLRLPLL